MPLHLNEADFVKKALGYAGFENNLMDRTTLKKLTTTQAIMDGIIVSNESQVEDMIILAVDLDRLIEDFVDLLRSHQSDNSSLSTSSNKEESAKSFLSNCTSISKKIIPPKLSRTHFGEIHNT